MKRNTLIGSVFMFSTLMLNSVLASEKDMVLFIGANTEGVKSEKISMDDYQKLIVKTLQP